MTRRNYPQRPENSIRHCINPNSLAASVPNGYHISRPCTSNLDTENRKSQGRKRIAVACSRCRKRKIKCTGDPGNGLGCDACRNSANSATGVCQFLRVNSQEIANIYGNCGHYGSSSSLYSQNSDSGFLNSPVDLNPIHSDTIGRPSRHYVTSLYYGAEALESEAYSQSHETSLEALRYASNGTAYNPLNTNLYAQTCDFNGYDTHMHSKSGAYGTDSAKYCSNMQLGEVEGGPPSPILSMDGLIHSLPTSISSQRQIPNPRICQGPIHPLAVTSGDEQTLPLPLSMLKSQGYGSSNSANECISGTAAQLNAFPSAMEPVSSESPPRDSSLRTCLTDENTGGPFQSYDNIKRLNTSTLLPNREAAGIKRSKSRTLPQGVKSDGPFHGKDYPFDTQTPNDRVISNIKQSPRPTSDTPSKSIKDSSQAKPSAFWDRSSTQTEKGSAQKDTSARTP